MITEDYVSFEVAKLLKERGFECEKNSITAMYNEIGEFHPLSTAVDEYYYDYSDFDKYDYVAPTLQMAMKWLRDEKNIHIKVHCSGNRNYLVYAQSLVTAFHDFCIESKTCSFNTYEEAVEAAIKYCLTNLI